LRPCTWRCPCCWEQAFPLRARASRAASGHRSPTYSAAVRAGCPWQPMACRGSGTREADRTAITEPAAATAAKDRTTCRVGRWGVVPLSAGRQVLRQDADSAAATRAAGSGRRGRGGDRRRTAARPACRRPPCRGTGPACGRSPAAAFGHEGQDFAFPGTGRHRRVHGAFGCPGRRMVCTGDPSGPER
jgi:hypothetical protein